jgi:hypothetical protein
VLMRISERKNESASHIENHASAYRAALLFAQDRFHAVLHVVKVRCKRKRPGRAGPSL